MGSPWIRLRSIFFQHFKGLLFGWTLWIYLPNLTFVALPISGIIGGTVLQKFGESLDSPTLPILPNFLEGFCSHGPCEYTCQFWSSALFVPDITGGTQKIWAVPVYADAPFSAKFLMAFVRMEPVNIPAEFKVRGFTCSWDNRRYSKNLGSPWIRPRSIFSQNFKGLLFGWTLWIYLPNLKFVALSGPEIIGGTRKIWAVTVYAHAPFSPKFLTGFCSHGPC